MKVARVNGPTIATLGSLGGLGGATPIPDVGDLGDVDLGGIADGDTIIWDDATDTWVVGPGGGGGGSVPWSYAKADGGLAGDGNVVTDAAITSGTDDLTSATAGFVPGDVGKTILVRGAGAAGADLSTTISAYVSATQVTLAANAGATVSSRFAVFGTDDTAAFQAWLSSVTASYTKSGWFRFEDAIFIIAGALQDTGARNAQILFPSLSVSTGHQITITFAGAARPPIADAGITVGDSAGYSVLFSTLMGASGTAAVFSGGQYPVGTNVQVNVHDLICVAPNDSTVTFWNLDSCRSGGFDGVYVESVGTFALAGLTESTNSSVYAVKLPHYGFSNYTYVNGLIVVGWYTGLRLTDLSTIIGYGFSWCIVGMEIPEHQHSSLVVSIHGAATKYPVKVTGDAYVDILQASFEHNVTPAFPAWTVTVADILDASNFLHGHVRWFTWRLDTGLRDGTFTISGGANIKSDEIGEYPQGYPVGTAGGDLSGTYPNPSVVNDSHTHGASTIDLTGEAAGGDLSGTYPNPSVVDDSHIHTSATAPGGGSKDHEHIQNVVFSGDGATTVWELPAAPVDATGIVVSVTGSRSIAWALSGALLTTLTFDAAPAAAANNIVIDIEAAVA